MTNSGLFLSWGKGDSGPEIIEIQHQARSRDPVGSRESVSANPSEATKPSGRCARKHPWPEVIFVSHFSVSLVRLGGEACSQLWSGVRMGHKGVGFLPVVAEARGPSGRGIFGDCRAIHLFCVLLTHSRCSASTLLRLTYCGSWTSVFIIL